MKNIISFILVFEVIAFLQFSDTKAQNIRVNQVGYYPSVQKLAVVPGAQSGNFMLINNQTGAIAYTGTLPSSAQTWSASGESIKLADFSSFTTVGSYYVKTSSETSQIFEIKAAKIYDDLTTWAAKGFYLWRASSAIAAQYATFNGTSYARSAGHADNNVIIHSSAATSQRPAGTVVSAPKGWYDAGDYNLYVINAGVSVFMLAHAYELYPQYFASKSFNIPESGNATPDILDEIKWEMDWLLAMQDLDGGVYFKLTSKWFCGYVMPANDNLERYMVGKSTTSALDFAAMTAMAYRLFKNSTDYPGFADKCLTASEKAWTWAKNNQNIGFTNPSDISTGGYGDTYFGDEFFWAASELLISTGKQSYYNELNFYINFYAPSWPYVAGNGIMSLALHKDNLPSFVDKSLITSKFTTLAEDVYTLYNQSTYKVPLADFYWGSNGDMASKAVVLESAYKILNTAKYKIAAEEGLNYLLGRNATGYCFVSGFGDKYPVDLHDRRSQGDGIQGSLPGYMSGGPNTDAQSDCGTSSYPSTYKAKSYVDKECSYSTNEIAINWNAPLLALLAMTETTNNSSVTIATTITAPANNATYCNGTATTITATATISSGSINSISFYDGTTLLNTDNASPYSFSWTNASVGTHTIKAVATGSNGSTAEANISITVNAIPATPTATANSPLCEGSILNLSTASVNGATYSWSGPESFSATSNQTSRTNVSNAMSGNYTIINTVNGCSSAASSVGVTVNAIPPAPGVTSSVTYNQYATAMQLTASGNNLLWYTSNNGGTGTSTAPTPSTATAGTSYYYVSQTTNSCESSRSQITVIVNAVNKDCAGIINGTASLDACGMCSGGNTGIPSCSQLEAETGTLFEGVMETTNIGYSGTGYVNGDNTTGASLSFALMATFATTININIRYAHNTANGRPASIAVNSNQQIASFDFPTTGSFTTWDTLTISLSLAKGINIITFASINTSGLANIDKIWYNQSSISFKTIAKQTIALNTGWNLISTNLSVVDSSILKLFAGLQVAEIKTQTAFWRLGQPEAFNSLKTITPGEGYLVNMNSAGTFTIIGTPIVIGNSQFVINLGWQIIGCPYQIATPFSTNFNATNCSVIKNFEGYWIPNETSNSILNLEPGKGYFILPKK